MSELLGLGEAPRNNPPLPSPALAAAMPRAAEVHPKLVKADFHGSIVTVRRSKNPALVGVSGIVVQETENTFKVVTRKDKLKVLPKQGSVFVFAVPLYSTVAVAAPMAGSDPGALKGSGELSRAGTVLDGPRVEMELYGNQFCFRAADRVGRKFKHKETVEL
ncbi:Rof/RNase P-like protein [Russula dissimulans]|nr:Rof/RNase P-like protein [Russula dissimulans]